MVDGRIDRNKRAVIRIEVSDDTDANQNDAPPFAIIPFLSSNDGSSVLRQCCLTP